MAWGKKTGGRQKGTPNKRTAAKQALVVQATQEGITPLEVMLGAMRDAWAAGDKEAAANFAKDAAPYLHPKLSSVEHKGDPDNPLEQNSRVELVVIDAGDSQGIRPSQAGAITQTRPI